MSANDAKAMPAPTPVRFAVYVVMVVAVAVLNWSIKTYRLFPTILMCVLGAQVAAVVGVPLAVLTMRWRSKNKAQSGSEAEQAFQRKPFGLRMLPHMFSFGSVVIFALLLVVVRHLISDLDHWTGALLLQVLGFSVLVLKVVTKQSVAGISSRKLAIDAVVIGCRLVAVSGMGLRLPRKQSTDFMMFMEILSFLMVVGLLLASGVLMKATYQAYADTFPVLLPALGAFVLGFLWPCSIGSEYMANAVWSAALYLECISMLPQLRVFAESGGVADGSVSTHIVLMFLSRIFGVSFFWMIQGTWSQGRNSTGWTIYAAYAVYTLLLTTVVHYYIRSCFSNGPFSRIPIVCKEN